MFDYKARQKKLSQLVLSKSDSAMVIVFGGSESIRNSDVHYAYRPDSTISYLTGFKEEQAIIVYRFDKNSHKLDVFSLKKDLAAEIWTGRRAGLDGAKELTQADESHELHDFSKKLPKMMKGYQDLYFMWNESASHRDTIFKAIKSCQRLCRHGGVFPNQLKNLAEEIGELRLVKDAQEIECMKKAAEISVKGHLAAIKAVKTAQNEFDLEASLTACFLMNGSQRQGYTPIVAAGENACVLHYVENNMPIEDNDLVLIDAGCEYQMYTADITRTFPASGKFSEAQKNIYTIVLNAQKAGINEAVVGSNMKNIDRVCREILAKGLIELGLLNMDIETALTKVENAEGKKVSPLQRFYPHGTGHYLGLDVHDIGRYHDGEEQRAFVEGVALTVEPGIYCQPDDLEIPEKYRGIGVRIEDDILIQKDGPMNLTAGLIKEISEIEDFLV